MPTPSSSPRLDKLNSLLAIDPTDPFILYGLAQEHAKLADHARAIGFYDRCLAADPNYCYAYYHKARSQQAVDNLAGASETVQAGMIAAHKAGDAHAASELSTLQVELAEAS